MNQLKMAEKKERVIAKKKNEVYRVIPVRTLVSADSCFHELGRLQIRTPPPFFMHNNIKIGYSPTARNSLNQTFIAAYTNIEC